MAADTNPQHALQSAVATATGLQKLAAELKSRLDKAPKAADPAAVKAAAERLVDFRWVDGVDVEKVAQHLSDPTAALHVLAEVAQKAAEKVAQLERQQGNPRLDVGRILTADKRASETPAESVSEADRIYHEKMAMRRQQLN